MTPVQCISKYGIVTNNLVMTEKTKKFPGWSFIRGGQTTMHAVRMAVQVLTRFFWIFVVSLVLIFAGFFWKMTTESDRYITGKWLYSYVQYGLLKNKNSKIKIKNGDNHEYNISSKNLMLNTRIQAVVMRTKTKTIAALICAVIAEALFLFIISFFTYKVGRRQAEDRHLRGTRLVNDIELCRAVRRNGKAGKINIAGIPLPLISQVSNVLFCGAPGTGKSQAISGMLRGVRWQRQRAIVYDISGDLIQRFYNPETDIILNPFDARSPRWDIWCEVRKTWDYQSIACTLIPDSPGMKDPFWSMAARILFTELARKCGTDHRDNRKFCDYISKVGLDEIFDYLKDTGARALLDKGAEKLTLSIRSTMVAYTQILRYLRTDGELFSIKDWVADEERKGWIFISSKEDQKEALKPLITCWIDIASTAILSLPRSSSRRIWYFFDELPTLNRVPEILNTLTNGRKYGGCGVIGFQNFPQMESVYRKNEANAIAEACSSWAIFRANGENTAEWASRSLGSVEILESNESLSYGSHTTRDGVNINKNRKIDRLVLAPELANLPDLHGYLRLGRGLPVGKFKVKYSNMKQVAEDFILRDDLQDVDLSVLNQSALPPVTEESETGTDSEDSSARLDHSLRSEVLQTSTVESDISEPPPEKSNGEMPEINSKSSVYNYEEALE